MPAYLVFNELSAANLAPDQAAGKRHLDNFSDVILDGRVSAKRILVIPGAFLQTQISLGYSIGRWLAEYTYGDRDRRQLLKLLFDRSIEYSLCIPQEDLESAEIQYECMGSATLGLATALLADGLAVSLCSADHWDVPSVDVERSWIGSHDIETEIRSVPHACRRGHLDFNAEWLKRTQSPPPANGNELWKQKALLFPNLDFCDSVEEQLALLGGSDRRFKAAMRGLHDLQKYCDTWDTGNFDIKALVRASGESASTLQKYSDE